MLPSEIKSTDSVYQVFYRGRRYLFDSGRYNMESAGYKMAPTPRTSFKCNVVGGFLWKGERSEEIHWTSNFAIASCALIPVGYTQGYNGNSVLHYQYYKLPVLMLSNDKHDKDDYCTNCVVEGGEWRVDFYLNLEIIERIRENGAEIEATTADGLLLLTKSQR